MNLTNAPEEHNARRRVFQSLGEFICFVSVQSISQFIPERRHSISLLHSSNVSRFCKGMNLVNVLEEQNITHKEMRFNECTGEKQY